MASTTRDPPGSVTTPGLCTAPTTSMTTTAVVVEVAAIDVDETDADDDETE
jgi:hypothetical protein